MKAEEIKEETYTVGQFVACIANSQFDVIKMAQDEAYRKATPAGVIGGRIIRKLDHEILTDVERGKTEKLITYIFEALNEEGKPIISQQDGRPMQIELPAHSIFRSPKAAADFLQEQLTEAIENYQIKVSNSVVAADKGLNCCRKVKLPANEIERPKLELVK